MRTEHTAQAEVYAEPKTFPWSLGPPFPHLNQGPQMTEDEMVGWHHQLSGHEFEQTPGDSEGQGSLACCNPWGHKKLDMT